MRQYLIHRKYYIAYLTAQKRFEAILNEQERILQKVHPKSSLAEHEREFLATVNLPASGQAVNKAEEYAIEMEQKKIRERLKDARELLQEREYLLSLKEKELRKSRDIYDRVYVYKWIDNTKTDTIIKETGYSRSQIYSIIRHLTNQIERSEE